MRWIQGTDRPSSEPRNEPECDVGAPAFGFAICLFSGAEAVTQIPSTNPLADVFANDGFRIAPIEVRVDSDAVQHTASQL